MIRALALVLAFVFIQQPSSALAQRFGGQFGAGGGFWIPYIFADIETDRSFGRDVGNVVAFGGRGFLQSGRVRLGGGGFSGAFTDEGVNGAGNKIGGGLSAGGFTAEYLLIRKNIELILGGMIGGATLTLEERLAVNGDVEMLNRRKDTLFLGYPWARLGYNPAPFINAGLQLGYLFGTEDFGGFAIGIDFLVGLIP